MTLLVTLSVIIIVAVVAVLAIYLFWVGRLLNRIADNLEASNQSVVAIIRDADRIVPAIEHINNTGGTVAGALPLLYGFTEPLVARETAQVTGGKNGPNRAKPSSVGRRRSRLGETVGYRPPEV